MGYIQQGDILLKRIERIPGNPQKIATRILAEGEHTGNTHRLEDGPQANFMKSSELPEISLPKHEVYKDGNVLYLRVFHDVPLIHEEHKGIDVPPGDYIVERVREYDPFEDEIRAVQD